MKVDGFKSADKLSIFCMHISSFFNWGGGGRGAVVEEVDKFTSKWSKILESKRNM